MSQLAEARRRCHLTQERLAELVGVTPTTVSRWEQGSAGPTQYNLERLSRVLGIPAEMLAVTQPKSVKEEQTLSSLRATTRPLLDHPSTYFVQDPQNLLEMQRLQKQDALLLQSMGGVLPEHTTLEQIRMVLDVACGVGGWLIAMAQQYPWIERLIGIDISQRIIQLAEAQAQTHQLQQRVSFQQLDALQRPLPFPDDCFDLVNQRLAMSYLRVWDWKPLLTELRRITRPGGIIRLTEGYVFTESNSPTLNFISLIWLEALFNAGRLFTLKNETIPEELPGILAQVGLKEIQSRAIPLTYQAGTDAGQRFAEDIWQASENAVPFHLKWAPASIPPNYPALIEQMKQEVSQPDFIAHFTLVTIWGVV